MKAELDRRRKYYLILDCETATLPFVKDFPECTRKKIAIAKPLIYDIGWTVIDKKGRIYKKKNFLISEIFSVPSVFNTAYYKEKRPLYIEMLNGGAIDLVTWREAARELVHDMELVEGVGAYNAMFDFKKAIPFTELYINELYGADYQSWENLQREVCTNIVNDVKYDSTKKFEKEIFRFRKKEYRLFDVWGLSCNFLLNNDAYKNACYMNEWKTESGKYFKTSAETAFRFCSKNHNFDEAHTALNDAEIESELFAMAVKRNKNNIEWGIEFFPFRILGTVEKFELTFSMRKRKDA